MKASWVLWIRRIAFWAAIAAWLVIAVFLIFGYVSQNIAADKQRESVVGELIKNNNHLKESASMRPQWTSLLKELNQKQDELKMGLMELKERQSILMERLKWTHLNEVPMKERAVNQEASQHK